MMEIMQRIGLEVLCVQKTKWKWDLQRRLVGEYKLLHARGCVRSNGMGIIISEEISKQVVRVERWEVTDSCGMVGDTEANVVCYVDFWATNMKD